MEAVGQVIIITHQVDRVVRVGRNTNLEAEVVKARSEMNE